MMKLPTLPGYEWRGKVYKTVGGLQAALAREFGRGSLSFNENHAFFRLYSGRTLVFERQNANAIRENSVISRDHV